MRVETLRSWIISSSGPQRISRRPLRAHAEGLTASRTAAASERVRDSVMTRRDLPTASATCSLGVAAGRQHPVARLLEQGEILPLEFSISDLERLAR